MSIDERLRTGLRATNQELPDAGVDPALAAVTAGSNPGRVRALAVALAAVAAVIAVVLGALMMLQGENGAPPPVGPVPNPTEKTNPVEAALRNGQITSAERYLGEPQEQGRTWQDFDPASGRALLLMREEDQAAEGLEVLGRTGPVATLTCDRDLPCSSDVATLGPGAKEVTVLSGERSAQVIGYDGTLRRRIDLSGTLTGDDTVRGLRWTPDGSRLAVLTEDFSPRTSSDALKADRVWLLDPRSGDTRLAYSLLAFADPVHPFETTDSEARGMIWFPGRSWSWSPDGQSLLLDVLTGGPDQTADRPVAFVLGLQPDGAAESVAAKAIYRSDRMFDEYGNLAWSPDGRRIAVRTRHHITEISADDGSVLAEHPYDDGWLIWPSTTN